jgi:hypothetical protein
MQALQAFGQVPEVRDSLPVKGPVTNEADDSGHPFLKLLASLRNAMKQDNESSPEALDPGSGAKSNLMSRGKFLSGLAGSSENGITDTEAGTPPDPVQRAMNPALKVLHVAGQPPKPGVRDSDLAAVPGTSLSATLGDKTVDRQIGSTKAGNAGRGTRNNEGIAHIQVPGQDPGFPQGAAEGSGQLQLDKEKVAGPGDNKLIPGRERSAESLSGILSRNNRTGLSVTIAGTAIAASGGFAGSDGAFTVNRNQNQSALRDKNSLATSVQDAKSSGSRSSRYSVVDMRLKATAARANADGQSEGKPAGNQAGTEPADVNRPGISGTDAAGRQIGNDHPATGFSESSKGIGAENTDKGPARFAENLASRLRDGGSMDIVRSAQVILKDGDAGLIRLRLEPESLGGVKIELKLADKQISARIIVESDLAGEAFRSSLDSLRDAFASSGFETTSIEVEVRDGRAGAGDTGRDDSGNDEEGNGNDLYLARKAGELGDAVPAADAAYGRYGVIDLVV